MVPEAVAEKRRSGIGTELFFFELYPIMYCLSTSYNELKTKLVGIILPFLTETIYYSFPAEYANSIWMIITCLFIELVGLLKHAQGDHAADEHSIGYFMSLQRSFVLTEQDQLRLAVASNLYTSMSEQSVFYVDKINPEGKPLINDLSQTIPKICSMSARLQNLWLRLSAVSRYNW